jgi:hypothetical protein
MNEHRAKKRSAAQPREQPEQQAHTHTEQQARNNRKIKRGVLAFMHDVSWQPPKPERQLSAKIKESPDKQEKSPQQQEGAPEFAKRIHG